MEFSDDLLKWAELFFNKEWFHIGDTAITLSAVLGLILILALVSWLAKTVEKVVYNLASTRAGASINASSIYALSRISRYIILFI